MGPMWVPQGLCPRPWHPGQVALTVVYLPSWQSEGKVSWWAFRIFSVRSSSSAVIS